MSYLLSLKQTPPPGPTGATLPGQGMDWVIPPSLPGQYQPRSKVLGTLRLTQMKDIARAWEIQIDLNGTREFILPVLEAEEAKGTFNRPPKWEYYYQRARFNSDQMKEAKAGGGFLKNGTPVTPLFPWGGPMPENETANSAPTKAPILEATREWDELRARAKSLGIKTFGKKRDELNAEVDAAEKLADSQLDVKATA